MPTPVILVVIDRQHRIDHRLQFGFLECGERFESGGLGFGLESGGLGFGFDRWWFRNGGGLGVIDRGDRLLWNGGLGMSGRPV